MSNMGVSIVDITPPLGIDFIGYHRPSGVKGILDRIYATAFIFELKSKKSAFISIDNIGMLVEDTKIIRERIAEKTKIHFNDITVVFTHTHSGPETEGTKEMIKSYKALLMKKVIQAAVQANENLQPCLIGWGLTEGKIGVNRRELMPNGKVMMGTNINGVVDKRIGTMGIKHKLTGKLLGLIVFCTAHPNVLKGDSEVLSADYPGTTRQILQEKLGCPVIIVQGAAGNVNARWRGSVDALQKMASTLSNHVLTMVSEIEYKPITKLKTKSSILPMKLKDIPEPKGIEEMALYAKEQWEVNTEKWRQALLDKYNKGEKHLYIELEVQLFQLNEGSFSGIPMEPFSESAIYIKDKLKDELAFYGGYTNGILGYLPVKEAYPYGGYEVEINPAVYGPITGLWMPPDENTADQVVNKVLELYKSKDE